MSQENWSGISNLRELPAANPTAMINMRVRRIMENLRVTINAPIPTFAEMLGISLDEYQLIRSGKAEYPAQTLWAIGKELNLSPSLFFEGSIDYQALRRQYFGVGSIWPEKYADPAHQLARARGIKSVLTYLNNTRGPEYAAAVMGRIQLNPAYFDDQQLFVSPMVGADLTERLAAEGFTDQEFRWMGAMSTQVCQSSELGKLASRCRSPEELYSFLHENGFVWFDHLFEYKVTKLEPGSCVMTATPRELGFDLFRSEPLGTRQMCLFKQGVFSSIIECVGHPTAEISESTCFYQGDSHCTYHLSWNPLFPRAPLGAQAARRDS